MKITSAMIDRFISKKNIAVAGVSKSGKGFGITLYNQLYEKGYNVYAINPSGGSVSGIKLYKNIAEVDHPVDAVVAVVQPMVTELLVGEAFDAGIKHFWMQTGSESDEAISFCEEKGMNVIHGYCLLMFLEPMGFFHKFHKTIMKWGHKLPA
ncbi:MAG: CoA-binding protein [Ignavibacteriales bacterium]|nr:MAG: CoA-binding protein [Ignavibacteriales bacterium]